MKDLFRIRRDERYILPFAAMIMVVLNAMMVGYRHELFTRSGFLGYWTLFTTHCTLSGYDSLTYVTLSNWKIYHPLFRHPIFSAMMYPGYLFNNWQMQYTDTNLAIYIVAIVMTVCGVCAFMLMYRIMREIMNLDEAGSLLLTMFFYSFGHVMVGTFAPDHFGISFFLLILTLYLAGRSLRKGIPISSRWTALLLILTAGITVTNGCKTLLASLFCNGRRFFSWRNMLVAVIFPITFLAAAALWQEYAIHGPEAAADRARAERRMKTDKKFAAEVMKRDEWNKTHAGDKLIDNPIFQWTDKSTSRLQAITENFFGESIQLHCSHLLEDTNRTRPNYVPYGLWIFYAIEAIIVLLFVAGVWAGRRDRFMQLCLAWFAVDVMLHIVLGFAILEVYIMALHWIFIIPIAIAYLIRSIPPAKRPWLYGLLVVLTLWLLSYNGILVAKYMM